MDTDNQKPTIKIRDLFDANVFRNPVSTAQYYMTIAEMKAKMDAANPSPTHQFIQKLNSKGRLLRWYTQNIDGLEWRSLLGSTTDGSMTDIPDARQITKDIKIIRLHGDIK